MLAAKQVPVLNLTEATITSQADLQTAFQSIHLCSMKEDKLSHGGEESKEDEDTSQIVIPQKMKQVSIYVHLQRKDYVIQL